MHKKQRGFTLIELLVVIAIIGMLSSVVLASLNTARAKARDAKRYADLRQLQVALELFYSTNGSYPAGTWFSAWDQAGGSFSTSCNGSLAGQYWGDSSGNFSRLATQGYINPIPHDPNNCEGGVGDYLGGNAPTDRAYVYSSNGQNYIIGTNLESGGTATRCGNYTITSNASYGCPI